MATVAPGSLEISYTPHARQQAFHTAAADEVLYGGAAGGGKSVSLLVEMFHQAMEQPGCEILLIRKTFTDLDRTLIKGSLEGFPGPGRPGRFPFDPMKHYNQSKHDWHFPNGSHLRFGHLQHGMKSVMQYQSYQMEGLAIDEVTEWESEDAYKFLLTRLRTTTKGFWPRVRVASNPIGPGFNWIKQRFVDPYLSGLVPQDAPFRPNITDDDPDPMSRCFIPARSTDNPTLLEADPSYWGKLSQMPLRDRMALRDGSWQLPALAGKLFEPEMIAAMADGATGFELARWGCGRCTLEWYDPVWVKEVGPQQPVELVLAGSTDWDKDVTYNATPTCKGCGGSLSPHTYVTAWDLAKSVDFTVGITADVSVEPCQIVAFERFNRKPWPVTAQAIEKRWAQYPGKTFIDSTGIGDPIRDFLGVPVEGILFTHKSKTDMIRSAMVMLERGELKSSLVGHGIEALVEELNLYEWGYKGHDDTVMALAMLASQIPRGQDLGISL